MPVVYQKECTRKVRLMHWGLVPAFTKADARPDFFRMFNARSETLHESPVFRRLLDKRRCVIMLDGFYEWRSEGRERQPYYIHTGEQPLLMAGLFDVCKREGEDNFIFSFAIITTDASKKFQAIHDRMPVRAVAPADDPRRAPTD